MLTALLMCPRPSAAQGSLGAIRGLVKADDDTPLAGVQVVAQSPALAVERSIATGAHGEYAFELLPPGHYVLSFEREGLVTVKRVTRLLALETKTIDQSMVAAEDNADLVTVAIDPESFPAAPSASAIVSRARLDRLPVEGGLSSVLSLVPGPLQAGASDPLLVLNGRPSRLVHVHDGRPLLDPGALGVDEATVVLGAAPVEFSRFRSGVVSVVTPSAANRLLGAFDATLTDADRFADALDDAHVTRYRAIGAALSGGTPVERRRSWLFVSGQRTAEPVASRRLLSTAAFPSHATDGFWQLRATRALGSSHRAHAQVLYGSRALDDVPAPGAVSAEASSALEDLRQGHRLLSASYDGVVGRDLQVAASWSNEQGLLRAEMPDLALPTIWDRQTGAVTGAAGWCVDCVVDDRRNTTWGASLERSLMIGADQHVLKIGVEREAGRTELPGPPADERVDLQANRLTVTDGAVYPVLSPDGSSWIIRRRQGGNVTHASDGLFVADDWRHGSRVTVQAGIRWDRQRLAAEQTGEPALVRSGISPRLSLSWQPRGRDTWTVFAGMARYEADALGLVTGTPVPSGDWYWYAGAPINAGDTSSHLPPSAAIAEALAWLDDARAVSRFSGAEAPWAAIVERSASGLAPTVEWTVGSSHRLGDALAVHADFLWRRRRPLPQAGSGVEAADVDATARSFERPAAVDLGLLTRRYAALILQARYDFGLQAGIAGSYTLSRSRGDVAGSPVAQAIADWASPPGDLADDRRHRLDLSGHVDLFESADKGSATVSVLQMVQSGRPFGIASWIDVAPWMARTSPDGPVLLPYFFSARDAFHTKMATRTDLSLAYSKLIPGTLRTTAFVRVHVLNLFDQRRVFHPEDFLAARTASTDPARFAPFNPFTGVPTPGVNWDIDPRLFEMIDAGTPDGDLTIPRAYRVSVGVRF